MKYLCKICAIVYYNAILDIATGKYLEYIYIYIYTLHCLL